MEKKRGLFRSNIGFILAAIGSAIGMGNLWGFPYKMGANGGFAFLIIYLALVVFAGVVVTAVEMTIGRKTGRSPILALGQIGKKWKFVGAFGVISAFVIMGFYGVIIGYSIRYFVGYIAEIFSAGAGFGGLVGADFFLAYTFRPGMVLLFTLLTFVICSVIVSGGIQNGIEKFNKVGIPGLFILLIVIIIYNFTLPGSTQGLTYMFTAKGMEMAGTDFHFFTAVRVAGGQMLFSLSLGMGAMVTYGSYLGKDSNISKNAWIIPAFDTLAAILAGLAIFPAVFAMGGDPKGGVGLLFMTMHTTFNSMGAVGNVVGALFYLLVIFAGVSSAISLMEVVGASIIDNAAEKGKTYSRKVVTVVVALAMFLISIPICIDQMGCNDWFLSGLYANFESSSRDLVDVYDLISEGILMPLGAVLMCLLVGWKKGIPWMKQEIEEHGNKFYCEKFFRVCVKYVTPILMAFVLISLSLTYLGVWERLGL